MRKSGIRSLFVHEYVRCGRESSSADARATSTCTISALREVDCARRRLRNLAWAGFDAQLRKTFGYDTNSIGTPFKAPEPGTSDDLVMRRVCGADGRLDEEQAVMSDLAEAIAAHRWFMEGDEAAAEGLSEADAWHEADARACAVFCAPVEAADEPVRSTAGARTSGFAQLARSGGARP